jgi:hypothetical protein
MTVETILSRTDSADLAYWHKEACRLSAGLIAICESPKTAGSSVLRSVAYDIALNCMDAETAKYQIRRRAGIADGECALCDIRTKPPVCLVPGCPIDALT